MIISRLAVPDGPTQRYLDNLRSVVNLLLGQSLPLGTPVVGLVVTSGSTFAVAHGLGRAWQGYVVTRSYGAATTAIGVCDGTASADPTQTLNLVPTATGTIDLWVF